MMPRRNTAASARPADDGFTLIELMVAIVIVAVISTGVSMGFGALGRAELQSAAFRIVAATRYAYNRSTAQGRTVRVVFDFEKNEMSIEEAQGKLGQVVIAREKDVEVFAKSDKHNDLGATDPWEQVKRAVEKSYASSSQAPKPPTVFGPIETEDGTTVGRTAPKPLGKGIRIARMYSPHEPTPREKGKGALYFFSGGRTEHAVVQLVDRRGRVFSVEVHPLTGKATVHASRFEPKELTEEAFGEKGGDVRDEG